MSRRAFTSGVARIARIVGATVLRVAERVIEALSAVFFVAVASTAFLVVTLATLLIVLWDESEAWRDRRRGARLPGAPPAEDRP